LKYLLLKKKLGGNHASKVVLAQNNQIPSKVQPRLTMSRPRRLCLSYHRGIPSWDPVTKVACQSEKWHWKPDVPEQHRFCITR